MVHVLDRDLRTRWSSGTTGESCLTLDLGETRQTAGAALLWYAPNHIEATLVVSASTGDGEYRTVAQQLLEGRGSIETRCAFEPATARYIRFELKNSSHESLSVYEAAALRPAVEREEASVR